MWAGVTRDELIHDPDPRADEFVLDTLAEHRRRRRIQPTARDVDERRRYRDLQRG